MKFPIALQLYTVREEAEADFKGTLQAVKDMGYDGVEFAGLFGNTPEQVKKMVDEIGLVPLSAHVPIDDMLADPNLFADYAKIGCKYIAVPYVVDDRRPGSPGFDRTVEDIKLLGAQAKKNGLQLLYHNHDFEFVKINGEYGLDVLYSSVSADLLQTELDTCWVNVGGANPAEYLLKYSGRSPVVHLKDFVMAGSAENAKLYELIGIENDDDGDFEEDFAFRPVGYGAQDFPAILEAAEKAGSQWVVVEQDRPSRGSTPMQSAKLSVDYLRNLK